MLKVYKQRFLIIFDTGHATQKLYFLFGKFHWVWRDVGGTSLIIKKMTDLRKIILDCNQC